MAKLNELKTRMENVADGKYNVRILSMSKADKDIFANEPIILKVLIEDTKKVQTIFLNTSKQYKEDLSIYERTCVDIYNQLNIDADVDTDDIEQMESLFRGSIVECYAISTLANDGKSYTNFYFNHENNKVKAYLAMS